MIQRVFHHTGTTVALFLNNTLEVDTSIAKGTIFGIFGSDKSLSQSMNRLHVYGQTIVETSMYTTVRKEYSTYEEYSMYITGTVRRVQYNMRSTVQ